MTMNSINGSSPKLRGRELRFPDFEVSCVAASGRAPGLCLGSEEGEILFFDEGAMPDGRPTQPIAGTSEAVNGLAFSGDLMAISSRSEIVFSQLPSESGQPHEAAIVLGGAHGVVATPGGRFVAPLGPAGLLTMGPGRADSVSIASLDSRTLNIYKVAALASDSGDDVLACATRVGGLAVLTLIDDQAIRLSRSFWRPGLDIIDVSGLGLGGAALAAAALGRDRSIHLSRDVLAGPGPVTMQFEVIQGTPYQILASKGHVFILTSDGLYVLPDLATRLVQGTPLGGPMCVKVVEMQAISAAIAHDQWLALVMQDCARFYEIDDLVGGIERAPLEQFEPVFQAHAWEESTGSAWLDSQAFQVQFA